MTKTASVMCKTIAILFLILLIIGLAVILLLCPFELPLPYGAGLFLGCALSVLKVILLEKTLNKSADMESKHAQVYASLQVLARYTLTAAVLLGAVFFPKIIGVFGVIFGILTLQISAYITSHIINRKVKSL